MLALRSERPRHEREGGRGGGVEHGGHYGGATGGGVIGTRGRTKAGVQAEDISPEISLARVTALGPDGVFTTTLAIGSGSGLGVYNNPGNRMRVRARVRVKVRVRLVNTVCLQQPWQ